MKKFIRFLFIIFMCVIAVVCIKSILDTGKQMVYPLRYEQYITQYAKEYDLDRCLVMGVIKAESNYVHDAHSGVARGLMQITDDTAKWIAGKMNLQFETDDIEDPETNIKMGCYYLRYLLDVYGDTDVALAAYNGGMGNVSKWLNDKRYSRDGKTLDEIPFRETREYVKKVNNYTEAYRKTYEKGSGK